MLVSSSGPESEARSHPRYSVHKLASYNYRGKRFLTVTLNLGLGGMMVDTPHYLSEDEELDIQLALQRNSISAKARVVHSRLISERQYISGLQFTQVLEQDQSSLRSYLTTLQGWPKP
jgi:hypothetical protein